MVEVGFQDSDTYVSRNQNTVKKYIATRPIMDLCLAANRRPRGKLAMRWWEQDGLDLEGMWTAAREADQTEGAEERDGTETEMEDYLIGEDTVLTITL